jgi:hypothetical protein
MTYKHFIDGVSVEVTEEQHLSVTIQHPPSEDEARNKRDNILATVVDPLVSNSLRWADLTAAKQTEWTTYRTDLLGVPQQAGFPENITWPTEPQ